MENVETMVVMEADKNSGQKEQASVGWRGLWKMVGQSCFKRAR